MINRFFFLFSACVFFVGTLAYSNASHSFPTHTQYTPIELKPISFNLEGSYQTASICFLGVGECDYGNNFDVKSSNQCLNEGYVSSCPSGQKLNKSGRCPYNDSYGTCCTEKCPNNSSTTCSGSVVADDGCGYQCKSCDPCPGYHDCGGTWQYCTGTTCYADSTRCSVSCKSDYFPNKCDNKSDCKGIYRNGYCSAACTPACTESCFGDSTPKTGEGWTYSTCTTCSGTTLYNNSPKSCPSGYSTTVDSCDTAGGYRLSTSGKSGNSVCGKCTSSSCPDGYSTDITSCEAGYSLKTSGSSGGLPCKKCECNFTSTSCSTGMEPTQSCVRNGTTYYKCESCTRSGGSAYGYKTCSGESNPTGALICGSTTYYRDCGCQGYDNNTYTCPPKGTIITWYQSYGNNYCEGVVDGETDTCLENGVLKTFRGCYSYVCSSDKAFQCDPNAHLVPSSVSFNGYTCINSSGSGFLPVIADPILKN